MNGNVEVGPRVDHRGRTLPEINDRKNDPLPPELDTAAAVDHDGEGKLGPHRVSLAMTQQVPGHPPIDLLGLALFLGLKLL